MTYMKKGTTTINQINVGSKQIDFFEHDNLLQMISYFDQSATPQSIKNELNAGFAMFHVDSVDMFTNTNKYVANMANFKGASLVVSDVTGGAFDWECVCIKNIMGTSIICLDRGYNFGRLTRYRWTRGGKPNEREAFFLIIILMMFNFKGSQTIKSLSSIKLTHTGPYHYTYDTPYGYRTLNFDPKGPYGDDDDLDPYTFHLIREL